MTNDTTKLCPANEFRQIWKLGNENSIFSNFLICAEPRSRLLTPLVACTLSTVHHPLFISTAFYPHQVWSLALLSPRVRAVTFLTRAHSSCYANWCRDIYVVVISATLRGTVGSLSTYCCFRLVSRIEQHHCKWNVD